ncbi:type II toxin-antitoxin system Phd/YefM family antitoxin [Pelosinus sp. UFO1]|uniref:type II toxin-antitoxin system Phd/YefM family antitoxin n=1 Tax=Pelosinus sp. UFO1 TaxID=484770 RepID=UPI0004D0BEC7|nr:type II toxin-antitoxin system Phd/YefM family antitoxin [Pelosinus sp. UFO1]AIF53545.1 prevent-host-death family protein [Pelosinus sp. UFO1]
MPNKKNNFKKPIEHYNMSEFLKGQASKILTGISDNNTTAFVLKNGKPKVVVISYEKYKKLLEDGVDINTP